MMTKKERLEGEKLRVTHLVNMVQETLSTIDHAEAIADWHGLREAASALVNTASKLQAQAAVVSTLDPTETMKEKGMR
jgi:hypothetical protein